VRTRRREEEEEEEGEEEKEEGEKKRTSLDASRGSHRFLRIYGQAKINL